VANPIVITLPAEPTGARVIFRNAQARVDHLWRTELPFDLKVDAHLDVLLQVAFELGRLSHKRRMSDLSRRVNRGNES
jgi:hypothetical protein